MKPKTQREGVDQEAKDGINQNLTDYLNDHLAGSVAAIQLIEDWREVPSGPALRGFFAKLQTEIVSDQAVLKSLLGTLEAEESTLKKAGAWLGGKVLSLRLQSADPRAKEFGLLEALEVLALGIHGKRLLWRALAVAASSSPALAGIDLPALEHRATEQFNQVEDWRLVVARSVFGPPNADHEPDKEN